MHFQHNEPTLDDSWIEELILVHVERYGRCSSITRSPDSPQLEVTNGLDPALLIDPGSESKWFIRGLTTVLRRPNLYESTISNTQPRMFKKTDQRSIERIQSISLFRHGHYLPKDKHI
jgi:hypothetical protein